MLPSETIGIIKQTVPALVANGELLTQHFYRRMFAGNPEVTAFFNPAHQHAGSQQKALAGAICAYAQHIDQPQNLVGALELIAQKHASLGILPEHYPIVGKHLLGSIREVLGEAATDEIIDAWAAAYQMLADLLIGREIGIYQQHLQHHGWRGFQPFVVQKKVRESKIITSFYLVPRAGGELREFEPGQYITVRVPCGDGKTTMRNYSLSGAPGEPYYRISVKRETARNDVDPAGQVSNYLHDQVNEGDCIELGPPCGEFTLNAAADDARPLVLLSAGVGITPVLSMLHAAIAAGGTRDALFIHCAQDGDTHAFRREVLDLADAHPRLRVHFRYSRPTRLDREQELLDSEGFIDAALFDSLLDGPDAEFYFCGPTPFMASAFQILTSWGVSEADLHYEFFGPADALHANADAGVTVG